MVLCSVHADVNTDTDNYIRQTEKNCYCAALVLKENMTLTENYSQLYK